MFRRIWSASLVLFCFFMTLYWGGQGSLFNMFVAGALFTVIVDSVLDWYFHRGVRPTPENEIPPYTPVRPDPFPWDEDWYWLDVKSRRLDGIRIREFRAVEV